MATLSEAQRKWLEELTAVAGGGGAGTALKADPVEAEKVPQRSGLAGGVEQVGGTGARTGEDVKPVTDESGEILPTNRLNADTPVPDYVKQKVKVGRIAPRDADGGPESEREGIWVEYDNLGVVEEVSIYQMLNSPDYVNTGIVDAIGKLDPAIPWTERPKVIEMTLKFKSGNFVKVPMKLVYHGARPQAKRFLRKEKGGLIYPVSKGNDVLFDTINTSNVVLCADWMEWELDRRLKLNLKVIEIGATFAKILTMNTSVIGPKGAVLPGQGVVPKGNNVVGRGPGGKGVVISPPGKTLPTGSAYTGRKGTGGTPKGTPTNGGSKPTGPGGGGKPKDVDADGLPRTSMRLDESPKGTKGSPGTPKPQSTPPVNKPTGGTGGSPKTGAPDGNGKAGKPAEPAPKLGQIKQAKQDAHSYMLSKRNENKGAKDAVQAGKPERNQRVNKMMKMLDGETPGASLLNQKYSDQSMQKVIAQKVQSELNAGNFKDDGKGGKTVILDMGEPTGWVVDKNLNALQVQKLDVRIDSKGGWHFFPTDGGKLAGSGATVTPKGAQTIVSSPPPPPSSPPKSGGSGGSPTNTIVAHPPPMPKPAPGTKPAPAKMSDGGSKPPASPPKSGGENPANPKGGKTPPPSEPPPKSGRGNTVDDPSGAPQPKPKPKPMTREEVLKIWEAQRHKPLAPTEKIQIKTPKGVEEMTVREYRARHAHATEWLKKNPGKNVGTKAYDPSESHKQAAEKFGLDAMWYRPYGLNPYL